MSASVWAPGADFINVDAESSNLSQVFTATASQTLFTLTAFSYTVGGESIAVYRGGQRLIKGIDWVETTSTSITIQGIALAAGETIEVVAVLGAASDASIAAAASAASAAASAASAALADITSNNTRTFTNKSIGDNLRLTGTGARITGDFSNATVANRVMFQTSTVNGGTSLCAIPNGTNQTVSYNAFNSTDPANASTMTLLCAGTEARIQTSITGTGTYLPMTFYTGGSERMRIDTSGRIVNNAGNPSDIGAASAKLSLFSANFGGPAASGTTDANVNFRFTHSSVALDNGVYAGGSVWWQARSAINYATNFDINFQPNGGNTLHVGPFGGLGYGTGAGGTVTQATSKSTAVTLNKPTGRITMHNEALAAGATVGFQFNNSLIGSTDVIVVSITNANGVNVLNYRAEAHILNAGVSSIKITNISGSNLSEALVMNFAIIKGATA